jgi:hypothetical protein
MLLECCGRLWLIIVEDAECRCRKSVNWIAFAVDDRYVGQDDARVGLNRESLISRKLVLGLRLGRKKSGGKQRDKNENRQRRSRKHRFT